MKVSAAAFAIAVWAAAAFIFVVQLFRILGTPGVTGMVVVGVIALNLVYVGALAGLGAIIALLGEIRTALEQRRGTVTV